MKVTYDNYEVYALEYLEGVLSPEMELAFEDFLLAHPDIKEEVTGLAGIYLTPEPDLKYHSKDQLYHIPPKGLFLPLSQHFWAVAATILLLVAAGGIIWLNHIAPGSSTKHLATNHQETADQGGPFILPDSLTNQRESEYLTRETKENTETPKSEIDRIPLSSENDTRSFEKEDIVGVLPQKTNKAETSPTHFIGDNTYGETLSLSLPEHSKNREYALTAPASILPTSIHLIETSEANRISALRNSLNISAITETTYKIHIPGEFFSETWTDLSLNNFGKKLIPEFFKSE